MVMRPQDDQWTPAGLPTGDPARGVVVGDNGVAYRVLEATKEPVPATGTHEGWVTFRGDDGRLWQAMPTGIYSGGTELGTDTDGGGGGGWGWGGGWGGTPDLNQDVHTFADSLFGYGVPGSAPPEFVQRAIDNEWTQEQMVFYAVTEYNADGPVVDDMRNEIEYAAAEVYGPDWSEAVPESMIMGLLSTSRIDRASNVDYFRSLPEYDVMKDPSIHNWIDFWTEQTGIPLTYTARVELGRISSSMGVGDVGYNAWVNFVEHSDSAKRGNFGAAKRGDISALYRSVLRRDPTDDEIDAAWDMSPDKLYETISDTPEYQQLYDGKPVWMSEADWWAQSDAWDMAYRQAFGINTYELSMMEERTDLSETELRVMWASQATVEDRYGIDSKGFWQEVDGKKVYYKPADIAAKLGVGYDTAKKTYYRASTTVAALPGMPVEMRNSLIAAGYDPKEWLQHIEWTEQAIVNEGVYDPILMETMGIDLSKEDWYKFTSHAIGWGSIQLKIIEGQNRSAFREVFRNYTGHDPSPGDYDYLMSNFVSPSEYARRMAAKEEAASKLPEVNELLERVYGTGTSLADLENMAMGGEGSGALEAQINQAMKLDQYRWVHKQYYGVEPTPADYAKYAGYATPAELQWEITVTEKLAEFGPDIREAWKLYYGADIGDQELRTLFGEMQGAGDIAYKVKKAEEFQQEQERARDVRWQAAWAYQPVAAAVGGGFKSAMPGLSEPSMN